MQCGVESGVVFATARVEAGVMVMDGHVFLTRERGSVVSVDYHGYPRRRKGDGGEGSQIPQGPPVGWAWPSLWAFLTASIWEDQTVRVTGTVTLFTEAGRLKACFNDRDSGEVGFVAIDPREPVLDQLEGALLDESIDWRRPQTRGRK